MFYFSYTFRLQTTAIFTEPQSVEDLYSLLYWLSNIIGKLFMHISDILWLCSIIKILLKLKF